VKSRDISENQVNQVYLSLGSNLGNKKKNLEFAKYLLNSYDINVLLTSSFYQTKSWPNEKFPDFFNVLLLTNTRLTLIELFKKIKFIEQLIGRTDTPKNYPRICDIDIIDFNNKCSKTIHLNKQITVPHASLHKRNFVLMPLYEINKKWIHPKFKKNIVKLISFLPTDELRSIKLV